MLQIKPVDKKKMKKVTYTTIFSAERDNNGKGIPAEDFIKVLEKMQNKSR